MSAAITATNRLSETERQLLDKAKAALKHDGQALVAGSVLVALLVIVVLLRCFAKRKV